uniref:Integrin alpha-X-like third Ig-like domain-containing protein n=1 Tax=Hucho hucho TaxID=62062 RepID=A0A4W5Q8K3_9TELE
MVGINHTVHGTTASWFCIHVSLSVSLFIHPIVLQLHFFQYPSCYISPCPISISEVENIGHVPAPVNVTFVIPVELDSGYLWNVSLLQTDNSRGKCERKEVLSKKEKSTLFYQHCSGVICHLVGCTIGLSSNNQPTIFKFVGNISRNSEGSAGQVEVVSWGSLSFDQSVYSQYPAVGSQSVKILSILETTPESHTALIASISVVFSLLLLTIISGVLYKMGFFKSRRIASGGVDYSPAVPARTAAPDDDHGLTADITSLGENTL